MSTTKPEILVVAALPRFVLNGLEREFVLHDYHHARDKDGLLARVGARIRGIACASYRGPSNELMEALPNLEIVSNFGVGLDQIDLDKARELGVIVTNTPDVLTDCVADMAMALVLAVARGIVANDRYLRAGEWMRKGPPPLATKVWGKRMGIVGLGRIGRAIARRAEGFGMTICYQGPRAKPEIDYPYFKDPATLAASVDFLVVACPGGPATYHLVDAEVLRALGREGYLVNIARGSVVDEAALVEALRSGTIAGAGLDVFENEPEVPEALVAMDNVVLQPHMASATTETREAMGRLTVDNLVSYFSGRGPITPAT